MKIKVPFHILKPRKGKKPGHVAVLSRQSKRTYMTDVFRFTGKGMTRKVF